MESQEESWQRPSPRLLKMRRTELGIVGGVVLLVAGISVGASAGVVPGVVVAGALLLVAGLLERLLRRRYNSWGYCERSADLLVRRGVLFKRLTVVPYGRMQLVDVTAGAVERLYHLQSVHLHTAAATTDARIPGLEPGEATRLRDRLAVLGEAQATGI